VLVSIFISENASGLIYKELELQRSDHALRYVYCI